MASRTVIAIHSSALIAALRNNVIASATKQSISFGLLPAGYSMHLPFLSDLLQFKHEPVLKLYRQNHSRNKLSAEDAFHEVLKYLWLAQHHELQLMADPNNEELPSRLSMLTSMREIDDMWHEFILFTQDYTNFCRHYFGTYMHHLPNIFDNAPVTEEEGAIEIDKLLPYIQKHLGDATLRVWFADFLN